MSRGRGIITTILLFVGKTGIAYPSVCPIPKNVPISVPIWFDLSCKSYHPVNSGIEAEKPVIAEKAKEKQAEAGGAVRQKSDKAVIDTKKELAKVADVSHDTIQKAGAIRCSIHY